MPHYPDGSYGHRNLIYLHLSTIMYFSLHLCAFIYIQLRLSTFIYIYLQCTTRGGPLARTHFHARKACVVFQMSPFRVVTPKGDIWKTTRAQWGISTGAATGIPAQVREELWDDNALSSGSSSRICAGEFRQELQNASDFSCTGL